VFDYILLIFYNYIKHNGSISPESQTFLVIRNVSAISRRHNQHTARVLNSVSSQYEEPTLLCMIR